MSLLWSFVNPDHERRIRKIIREEYKGYHVGYLPVVLSHEVVGKVGEYERTMTAVLDAYLQTSIKFELESTWDQLRANGYRGTFLLTHNTGGSGEIFKTDRQPHVQRRTGVRAHGQLPHRAGAGLPQRHRLRRRWSSSARAPAIMTFARWTKTRPGGISAAW